MVTLKIILGAKIKTITNPIFLGHPVYFEYFIFCSIFFLSIILLLLRGVFLILFSNKLIVGAKIKTITNPIFFGTPCI